MNIVSVKLCDIDGLHSLSRDLVEKTASVVYASGPADYSEIAIQILTRLHPVHLIQDEGQFSVIGGFRTYELAKLVLQSNSIECVLHSSISEEELNLLAIVDILGSPLQHSLGPKFLQQLSLLTKNIGEKKASSIFPKLKSTRRMREQNRTAD